MGCDCTMVVEEMFGDGWDWLGEYPICRSYELFGHLAGARDSSVPVIHPQRGLPEDCSKRTRDFLEYESDHSFSWCTLKEALDFFKNIEAFEYLDNGFYAFLKYMAQAHEDELELVRFVYGFDS